MPLCTIYTVCKHVHLAQMKIAESSKNLTEISATEESKDKCVITHMENHMITQTQEELATGTV